VVIIKLLGPGLAVLKINVLLDTITINSSLVFIASSGETAGIAVESHRGVFFPALEPVLSRN